ncbi:Atg41p [Saccharomyces eubayanus]|uniref:Atg41p n=1 Tax=Saccharomyces eubayanus TaxID=1080349 RepID=UPI0006C0A2F8|nr:ICY2-like protein [Saccharomyces eubayanus]KOG96072.1 ICY2-like protein [Saccharomyces eubayanus]
MSSVESAAFSHYEDEVFPLSFSNAAFEPPMLSHSPDRSTYADEFSQSYQQELLTSPLSYPIADELEYTYAKNKNTDSIITSAEDDFIFDMEFSGSAVAAAAAAKESTTASGFALASNDAFANVAQQNYRLWLSSV